MKKWLLAASMLFTATISCVSQAKTYIVGAGGTYRPFEYETADQQLKGFDIDIIKAIAKAAHFDIKLVNTPWEGIFATLNSGDRDILVSGITITDKRKRIVSFSHPYFPAEQAIVIPKGSQLIRSML